MGYILNISKYILNISKFRLNLDYVAKMISRITKKLLFTVIFVSYTQSKYYNKTQRNISQFKIYKGSVF